MTTAILAIDDSVSIRRVVEMALKSQNYDVVMAADGQEALEALERGHFDLVLLDINMPHLDGLSLLTFIRERPEWSGLPVLMLTTEGQEADRDRAMILGANDYMVKPFKPTQLLERVATMLGHNP